MLCHATLPTWTEEELKALEAGEIIVGADLFAPTPDVSTRPDGSVPTISIENIPNESIPDIKLPPRPAPKLANPDAHQLPPIEDNRKFISNVLTQRYFSARVREGLSDPQMILENAERLDFQYALDQYSDASPVSIYLYLFDRNQAVPIEHSPEATFDEFYYSEPSAIVVYYFIDEPERAQVFFGGKDTNSIASNKIRDLVSGVRVSAKRHSRRITQLDEFIRQLSLHLFWIEKAMISDEYSEEALEVPQEAATAIEPVEKTKFTKFKELFEPHMKTIGLSVVFILLLLLCGIVLLARRRFFFPKLQKMERLSLPNGTTSGATLSFADENSPPSAQLAQFDNVLE